MRSSTKTYTITEYGGFTRGGLPFAEYQPLSERTFDALESFILANNAENDTGAIELLSLSVRRGMGKIITARNYVGIITMKDGTVIEILPKIYGGDVGEADTKRIFLEMLRTLKDTTFKEFNVSNLKTNRLSLFEIFISMFVSEVATLIKQGLKSSYHSVEANERFFKGKLNVSRNIKHNHISREKFFVKYDEWNVDRPENRLIKSTLLLLRKQTGDDRNRLNISRLLSFFDDIDISKDYEADFSKCAFDRSMSHYEKALSWCKVFLRGNSFTAFFGSEVAVALLFPMEKVFESYVAAKLRRIVPANIELRTQDTRYSLFDHPTKSFNLRPDLVLVESEKTIVMDTKWKMLSENMRNYGISQSDMYQMYAYGKKYNAEKIVLLYPQPENLRDANISFCSDDGISVKVSFIDLLQLDKSIAALMQGESS
jgi:5-methylcytosine-specific restriction enzyme subunit McrC